MHGMHACPIFFPCMHALYHACPHGANYRSPALGKPYGMCDATSELEEEDCVQVQTLSSDMKILSRNKSNMD